MRLRQLAIAAAFGCVTTLAQAAGLAVFEVPAGPDGPTLKVMQWSPCAKPPDAIELGPFSLPAVRDCPIAGSGLPLVVLSHGFGGTNLSHHDTAEALADAGFIVVAPNHPDDTASNRDRGRGLAALTNRPTDIRRLIDYMLGTSPAAAHIDARRIGFFGFSRGGYTGLVLAGARPDFRQLRSRCQDPTGERCEPITAEAVPAAPPMADPRIGAFVIADPLSSVFRSQDAVKAVSAPMQLWGSERGGDGVSPNGLAAIVRNLPKTPEVHIVPNSGHFAFLTICPASLAGAVPELCVDAPGFDRAAFHADLNRRAVAFLLAHLPESSQP